MKLKFLSYLIRQLFLSEVKFEPANPLILDPKLKVPPNVGKSRPVEELMKYLVRNPYQGVNWVSHPNVLYAKTPYSL